jgi:hypothetical protein
MVERTTPTIAAARVKRVPSNVSAVPAEITARQVFGCIEIPLPCQSVSRRTSRTQPASDKSPPKIRKSSRQATNVESTHGVGRMVHST